MKDTERELFEAWMREAYPGVNLQRRVDGEYWSNTPDNFWAGWKARSALPLHEAIAACQVVVDSFDLESRNEYLTDAGKSAYTSAKVGALACISFLQEINNKKENKDETT